MTPKKAPDIIGQAVLANVSIGMWQARKHDRAVTEKVNKEMANSAQAGRYHKKLFGGAVTSHSAIVTAVQVARRAHFKQTLPWEDDGWRILPTANYYEYTASMRDAQDRFRLALENFLGEYPKLVTQAEERLGRMWKRDDYPKKSVIADKFHFGIEFTPIPTGDDFRVRLPKTELAAMTRSVEERVTHAVKEAMQDAWKRLGDSVHELRGRLDDGKWLRDSMLENIGEIAEILGRLNLTNDAALEKARTRVLEDLAGLDVNTLRGDDKVRGEAAQKADAILKAMKNVYTPAK